MTGTRDLVVVDHALGIDTAAALAMRRSVGGIFRQVRLARGETQMQVGLRAGLCNSEVCRLELASREPSLGLLLRLCGSVEVRPSAVLRLAEDDVFPMESVPWAAGMARSLGRLAGSRGGDANRRH